MHVLLFAAAVALLAAGAEGVLEDVIITPGDGADGDAFGTSTSVSGSVLVAGAPFDDDAGSLSGSAYVFATGNGGSSWTLKAKLVAPDAAAGDQYGVSVAVDGSIAVVGAEGNGDAGPSTGSAYIHTTSDGGDNWSAGLKIIAADPAAGDRFGYAVAVGGSVVAVGAYGDDDAGIDSGSVYVFVTQNGGGSWAQTDKLTASDGDPSDEFGSSVGIDGGIMVIGAPGDASFRGAAYVFRSTDGGSTWAEAAKLTAHDAAEDDEFGWSVAVAGTIIAVGAPGDDDGADDSGSVYVFTTSDGGASWSPSTNKLASDIPAAFGLFGWSVSVSAGLMAVGAPYADEDRGILFVLETDNGGETWALVEKISASDGSAGSYTGYSVAVEGQLVVAGALEEGANDGVGAVYVHQYVPSGPGSVGDPVLVDFAGHRFLGGARGRTEYLLYRSQDDAEAITMTTGSARGTEGGFFAAGVAVSLAGCGSVRVLAVTDHDADITGDPCMTSRLARGDDGLVLIPIGHGGDAGSVLAVFPHRWGSAPAFVNLKLLGTTAAFRAGCAGMLCNEAHADIEA